ncbi:hypothetical protein [Prevotella sp. 10(H)]|uniref:hypothetical protein n=1 Tax=Prevotella sp. 10(H) TaxID=1158294 RepID=UPI000AA9D53E|nr:hypothetical protein [Prevotella sp. 10(H)]
MKKYIYTGIIALMATVFISCSDDYIIGGEINETNRMDISTFELLSRMEETQTVATLFERAGLKDVVNGDVTIVAPNQWSVNRYLRRRYNQALRIDPNASPVTIDDITAEELKKMGAYILPGKLWRETIPKEGKQVVAHDGTEVFISIDRTNTDPGAAWDGAGRPGDGYQYSNFMEEVPYIIHVHFKRGDNWEWTANERTKMDGQYNNPECDQVYRMYVSDILTTNGVVHVLYQGDNSFSDHAYYHSLFFFGSTTDDKL